MRLSHDPAKTHASFDDPNLVSRAGLVPVMALAQRCGLADLAGEHVTIASPAGVNPHLKIPCLVAGMAAGADSIDDMDVLRHGAMAEVFGGIRAPSTLGSFLRSFTWGNVRQLDAVARQLLAELASRAPLLPGADVLAFVDMDSMQKRVYGYPANNWSACLSGGASRGRGSGSAGEAAELFFVAADLSGEGFEAVAELVDLDGEAGEGEGVALVLAVFVDDGAQFGVAVEGGAADAGACGDLGGGDGLAGGEQVLAGLLDAGGEVAGHEAWVRVMSRSSRSASLRCRWASLSQPRAAASAARVSASARWAARMGRNAGSLRKFGQCSQMLA